MTKPVTHTRIPVFPYVQSLQGARLDSLCEERGKRHDLVLDYQEFSATTPSKMFRRDGKIYERIQGNFIPRRLRFAGIEDLKISGAYKKLDDTFPDHPAREIRDMLRWIQPGHDLTFYLLFSSSWGPTDDVNFYSRRVYREKRTGEPISVSFERDWSPTPPTRTGIIPLTKKLYERFGGDPIDIHLNDHVHQRCLFIGSLEMQPSKRPGVDSVLNLGERPSQWVKSRKLPDNDRWAHKGEGSNGMSVEEICQEADWVIERLKAGKRVLVHCVAGMNRSSTICCAALMLLEGLSAEQALERVREHHPWARPDCNHWLKLRWLAQNRFESLVPCGTPKA